MAFYYWSSLLLELILYPPTIVPSVRWLLVLAAVTVLFLTSVWVRQPARRAPPAAPSPNPARTGTSGVEEEEEPRLPERYWRLRAAAPGLYSQASCTRLAARREVARAAPGWQLLRVPNGTVYLYGGYWDARAAAEPLVRVLLYCDVTPLPDLYCQLWYPEDNAPLTVAAVAQYAWREEWGGPSAGVNEPYIVSCDARRHRPDPPAAPLAVSIVTEPCQRARNVLDVQGAPAPDEEGGGGARNSSIAVCLKWLDYRRDVSAQLVEWVSLLQAFGAAALYVHVVHAHPNVERVLRHYSDTGFARVSRLAHPPQLSRAHFGAGARDFHDLRRELLPLNDCLYRALHHHALLAAIDMDEIIVPVRDGSWPALVEREARAGASDALVFANYYLLDGAQRDTAAPPPARMLAHRWRARDPNPPGYNVKSFMNTTTVVAMHNHLPRSCGARACRLRDVDHQVARLHHYRERCADDVPECAALREVVRDDALARWAGVLRDTRTTLALLGL